MECKNCEWAIWYYGEAVSCCNDGDCPSEEDSEENFERAEKEWCLAI